MSNRYFLEIAYLGTRYAGFQKQQNASTIQGELEKAIQTFLRTENTLSCSSRTDAGVHARQNFFHADLELKQEEIQNTIYHINAILPGDIVLKKLIPMPPGSHCRFDAKCRYYSYSIHSIKDPFLRDTSYFYPYKMDNQLLVGAAELVSQYSDFASFSKRNTQAKTTLCTIYKSEWKIKDHSLVYHVEANRFLRGMVKALVGTMLRVARGQKTFGEFENLLKNPVRATADFSVPSKGLCLEAVRF